MDLDHLRSHASSFFGFDENTVFMHPWNEVGFGIAATKTLYVGQELAPQSVAVGTIAVITHHARSWFIADPRR